LSLSGACYNEDITNMSVRNIVVYDYLRGLYTLNCDKRFITRVMHPLYKMSGFLPFPTIVKEVTGDQERRDASESPSADTSGAYQS
jgi:hypothetical protein